MLPLFPTQIPAAVRTSNPSSIKKGKEKGEGGSRAGVKEQPGMHKSTRAWKKALATWLMHKPGKISGTCRIINLSKVALISSALINV